MDALESLYANYRSWFEFLELATIVFIPLAVVELFWDVLARTGRKLGETVANIIVAVGYEFSGLFINGLVLAIAHYFISPFALFSFEMTPVMWGVAILLADFSYYWMHRVEHEVRFFWAYHVTHHSSPEYDLTTAFRLSWVEALVEWVFLIPMLLLGFDAFTVFIALAAVATYQTWIHTQKIGKLGWLDKVINTPSAHRVHHGSNDKYLDKNYGGIFLVWDHLFGTYQAEEEKVVFGITEPIRSINPLVINFHEYGEIIRDIAKAKTLGEAWSYMFAHPGWKPVAAETGAG